LIYSQIWIHGLRDDRQLFYNFVWIIANLATKKKILKIKINWASGQKESKVGKGAACGELIGNN
jgi:hypothetical protein